MGGEFLSGLCTVALRVERKLSDFFLNFSMMRSRGTIIFVNFRLKTGLRHFVSRVWGRVSVGAVQGRFVSRNEAT